MIIGTQEIFLLFIIFVPVIIILWFLFGRGRQQQQQQQVVVQGEAQKKRVCPKCGWQNDRDAKFCSDCGFKFIQ